MCMQIVGGAQGAALAIKGQCLCVHTWLYYNQESASLWYKWLHWQTRASNAWVYLAAKGQQPLGVLAAKGQQPLGVLAAKGQHPCSYTRGWDDSQGLASLWVYKMY